MADKSANLALYQELLYQEWLSTEGPWDPMLEQKTEAYRLYLRDFVAHIRQSGSIPLAVYIPSYFQVYSPQYTGKLNAELREMTSALNIPFVDPTEELRRHQDEILFLAPTDFHMNPAGNQRIAESILPVLLSELRGARAGTP